MKYSVDVDSAAMIYLSGFMRTSIGVKAILKFRLNSFRDVLRWRDMHIKFHEDWYRR
jgi:hypothetical protein